MRPVSAYGSRGAFPHHQCGAKLRGPQEQDPFVCSRRTQNSAPRVVPRPPVWTTASDVDTRLANRIDIFSLVSKLGRVVHQEDRSVRCSSTIARRVKMTTQNSRLADSVVIEKSVCGFRVAQSWQTSGMLSPGLEDNCSSNERNRLPSRSSLNSHSATSRSTHASGSFASAIRNCRRFEHCCSA